MAPDDADSPRSGSGPRAGTSWTRDDYLAALDLYLNDPDVKQSMRDEKVQELADIMGRGPGAVSSRLGNFLYLDPGSDVGMSHASQGAQDIWEEYYGDEEELAYEARRARERLKSLTDGIGEADQENGGGVDVGETIGRRRERRGQSDFREAVRTRYGDACLLCDISTNGLLQASHILDWSENDEYRGDPANGLWLCYTHHRAFDLNMFTISEDCDLIVRPDANFDSAFLKQTLTDRDGHRLDFPGEPPSTAHLRKHNRDHVPWWPVGE